jgi:predicted MPP superfamily phosphohydrolase
MVDNLLADFDGFRLSLAGTASIALTSFLERNLNVQNIYLCLDNDQAGQKATERIINELLSDSRFANKNIIIAPPPIGKDYNETLTGIRQIIAERNSPEKQNQQNRSKPRKATHIKESPGIKITRPRQAGVLI